MSQATDDTKTLNLEELIYYMDQDSGDEYSQPKDIPTSLQDEDGQEEDDQDTDNNIDDDDDTGRSDNKEPEEVRIAPAQEASTDSDEEEEEEEEGSSSTDSIASYYNILSEQNLLFPDEDFEFDGTEESLQTAIEQTRTNISRAAQGALWQALPEKWRPALQYALEGGQDVDTFLSTMKEVDTDSLDVDNEDHQREILKRYYSETTSFSSDKINNLVEKASLANTLAEDAEDALEELKTISLQKQQKLLEQQAQDRQAQQEQMDNWRRSVVDKINNNEQIQTTRKKKVQAFMLNQIERNGETDTDFSRTIKKISANPEHLVQLADILADYDEEQGLDLKRFLKKGKTEATKTLKERLEEVTDAKTKVTGKGSKVKKQNFDWEEFLRQN